MAIDTSARSAGSTPPTRPSYNCTGMLWHTNTLREIARTRITAQKETGCYVATPRAYRHMAHEWCFCFPAVRQRGNHISASATVVRTAIFARIESLTREMDGPLSDQ